MCLSTSSSLQLLFAKDNGINDKIVPIIIKIYLLAGTFRMGLTEDQVFFCKIGQNKIFLVNSQKCAETMLKII